MFNLLEDRGPQPSRPRRFQFSLRTLFIVSFLFAIYCACIFSNFDGIRFLTLLLTLMAYPIVLLTIAIYAKGYLRSFGIGASIAFIPFLLLGGILVFYTLFVIFAMQQGGSSNIDLDLTKSTSMEAGLEYFWPSLCVLLLLLYSALFGSTMVLTRWLIDRSQRQAQVETPRAAPQIVPAPHLDTSPKTTVPSGACVGSDAGECAKL